MTKLKESAYSKIVSQVGQYIHDHYDKTITLDELAAYTGFSKYHFNRIFTAATGFQLGEYIQRCKLEQSLHLIKQGKHSVIEVALSVGYDSPSSFTRAFSKMFSVTPSDVVRGQYPVNERGGILPPKKSQPQNLMQPTWVELPEQKILGLSARGFSDQSFSSVATTLYEQLTYKAQALSSSALSFEALQAVGISIDNPWVGEQTQSQFFAGFLQGLHDDHHELEVFKWQAGLWACFTHKGPHNTMWQTISQVYALWVIPNGIRLKDQQIVQRYLSNPQTCAPENMQTELYFAVDVG